jgi:hypothetical protein
MKRSLLAIGLLLLVLGALAAYVAVFSATATVIVPEATPVARTVTLFSVSAVAFFAAGVWALVASRRR